MLESLTLSTGLINQDSPPKDTKPPIPAGFLNTANYQGFFNNSACVVNNQPVLGACTQDAVANGCVTMTTFLPIFDPNTPDAPHTGSRIVQTCYFDHGKFTFNNLDKALMTAGTGPKGSWINTGCARPCQAGAPCNALDADENKIGRGPTLQRLVADAGSALYAHDAHRARALSLSSPTPLLLLCPTRHFPPPLPPHSGLQLLQRALHAHHENLAARLHPSHAFLLRMVHYDLVRR
jgi:hypothetical protein